MKYEKLGDAWDEAARIAKRTGRNAVVWIRAGEVDAGGDIAFGDSFLCCATCINDGEPLLPGICRGCSDAYSEWSPYLRGFFEAMIFNGGVTLTGKCVSRDTVPVLGNVEKGMCFSVGEVQTDGAIRITKTFPFDFNGYVQYRKCLDGGSPEPTPKSCLRCKNNATDVCETCHTTGSETRTQWQPIEGEPTTREIHGAE